MSTIPATGERPLVQYTDLEDARKGHVFWTSMAGLAEKALNEARKTLEINDAINGSLVDANIIPDDGQDNCIQEHSKVLLGWMQDQLQMMCDEKTNAMNWVQGFQNQNQIMGERPEKLAWPGVGWRRAPGGQPWRRA